MKASTAYDAAKARTAASRFAQRWNRIHPAAVACLRDDLDELLPCLRHKTLAERKNVRTTNAVDGRFRWVRRRTRPMCVFRDRTSMDRILFAVFTHENKMQGIPNPSPLAQKPLTSPPSAGNCATSNAGPKSARKKPDLGSPLWSVWSVMRVIFMGTPEFAVPILKEISKSGRVPVAVYTRAPARGSRRGLEMTRTPVHSAADSLGIPVLTPTSLRDIKAQKVFSSLAADVVVVAAYGLLLPIPILESTRFRCINLHPSLLPRWRGAAPVQRAIMAGDMLTGVDVMCMDLGLDTGPIAMRQIIPIHPDETAGDLTSRLALLAATVSVNALQSMEAGLLEFHEQSSVGVCYAHKITKSEADVDWTQSAEGVRNQIHGLSPAPGAFSKVLTRNRNESIKFFRAEVATGAGAPGLLLSDDMRIACGVDAIRILQGQRPGKVVMSGHELMRGAKLAPGAVFTRSSALLPVPQP